MSKYNDLYIEKPIGFEFDEGMTKAPCDFICEVCRTLTQYRDANYDKYLCSDECRAKYYVTAIRSELTGSFETFSIMYRNHDIQTFTNVRVWFVGRYLYYEQLDIPEHPKDRLDTFDIINIKSGKVYDSKV